MQLLQAVRFKRGTRNQSVLNRISQLSIDFLIVRPDTSIVAAVELDDGSHRRAARRDADARKTHALGAAGIPLIRWVHQGGAISRVKPGATAFWHREAERTVHVQSDWDDPHDERARDTMLEWARRSWRAIEHLTDGFYVNTMAADDPHQRVVRTRKELRAKASG